MVNNGTDQDSADFSKTEFEKHLMDALEDYEPEYSDQSTLPEGTILTSKGLLQLQENPAKVRGGNFEVDLIFDAAFCIYGRLASYVAKLALEEWTISVVNVEQLIITGGTSDIVSKFMSRTKAGSDQGPYYPTQPDELFKRSVRGMLPHKRKRGRAALKRVRAYKGNPYNVDGIQIDEIYVGKYPSKKHMTLKKLSEKLGAEQDY